MHICKSLSVAVALAFASHASAAVIYTNPSTADFPTLSLNTPTSIAFPGTGGMTMTLTSAVGSGITLGTTTLTYVATLGSETNPDWVLGSRTYFDIDYASGSNAPYAGSTVSLESQFAGGLATTSQLVFVDFDGSEQVVIKAYDLANNLIPFSSMSLRLSAGQDSTPRFQDIEWASFVGATGRLRNIFEDSESNIVASINSTTSISRLVYEFDMNPDNDVSNPGIRFSFAAVPATAPAPPTVAIVLVGLACGGLSMWRRRKQV